MTAFYNEIDPACGVVLDALIEDGVIAPGHVEVRSIKEIQPYNVRGFILSSLVPQGCSSFYHAERGTSGKEPKHLQAIANFALFCAHRSVLRSAYARGPIRGFRRKIHMLEALSDVRGKSEQKFRLGDAFLLCGLDISLLVAGGVRETLEQTSHCWLFGKLLSKAIYCTDQPQPQIMFHNGGTYAHRLRTRRQKRAGGGPCKARNSICGVTGYRAFPYRKSRTLAEGFPFRESTYLQVADQ